MSELVLEKNKDLPKGWLATKFCQVIELIPTGVDQYVGIKEYFSTGSINKNNIESEGMFDYENRPSRANRISKIDDIFQARMKDTDKPILIDRKLNDNLFSTGFLQLRILGCCNTPKFYYYYVQSTHFLIQRDTFATGSTQTALTDDGFKKIHFLLPPLNEQKRITLKLECLFSILVQIEKILSLTKSLISKEFESYLLNAFNGKNSEIWRIKNKVQTEKFQNKINLKISSEIQEIKTKTEQIFLSSERNSTWAYVFAKNISSFISSGSRGWAKYYSEDGSYFVTVSNLNYDKLDIDFSTVKHVALPRNTEGIRTLLKRNDLLIAITGATIGKIGLVKNPISEGYVNQHVALVRPTDDIIPEFLGWFLLSRFGQRQIKKSQKGMTKEGIGLDEIRKLIVPLPSLIEQEIILNGINDQFLQVEKNLKLLNRIYSNLHKIKYSILKQAFEGKLVPQDPNDEPAEILLEKITQEKQKIISQTKRGKKNDK